jgi:hypothetical protein
LELANLTTSFDRDDHRPAMFFSDVNGLEIDNFKGQILPGVAAARFERVTNMVVRNSPELQ